jgi:hypothetical protein
MTLAKMPIPGPMGLATDSFERRTLGGFFKSPATSAVGQSPPALTRFERRTLGGFFKSPATSAVGQSPPALTR